MAALLAVATVATFLAVKTSAASGEITDPAGDAPSPYIDIVKAKVMTHLNRGQLGFQMKLAGSVLDAPAGTIESWAFAMSTTPAVHYAGVNSTAEYIIVLYWVGDGYIAELLDWTTATAADVYPANETRTRIPFSVRGNSIELTVAHEAVGSACSFSWRAATRDQVFPSPADDVANAGGTDPVFDFCAD
jgi:hypothetical protein